MSHTQDMVMITHAISLEYFGEKIFFVWKKKLGLELNMCQGNCTQPWKLRTTPRKASGTSKKRKMVIFKEDGYPEMLPIYVISVLQMLLSTQ